MLPELTENGELPPGVHVADWPEFQSRFCGSSLQRQWLSDRLRTLLELAATTGELRRVFIWGSFVTAKPAPKDLDVLLIMGEDFEVEKVAAPARGVFDSVRARLMFKADVFLGASFHWQRSARPLAEYLPSIQRLPKARYRGIGAALIETDDQMLLAQHCTDNLRKILLEARKVHSPQDYARMAEPVLLEIQQREQEILEYLSRDLEPPIAN